MSKHEIHGHQVEVHVYQGRLTDVARGRCIGKVVNMCRELSKKQFETLRAAPGSFVLSKDGAAVLEEIDAALASNYTQKYSDDYAPIASIKFSE